jgi:hypothetical protein
MILKLSITTSTPKVFPVETIRERDGRISERGESNLDVSPSSIPFDEDSRVLAAV